MRAADSPSPCQSPRSHRISTRDPIAKLPPALARRAGRSVLGEAHHFPFRAAAPFAKGCAQPALHGSSCRSRTPPNSRAFARTRAEGSGPIGGVLWRNSAYPCAGARFLTRSRQAPRFARLARTQPASRTLSPLDCVCGSLYAQRRGFSLLGLRACDKEVLHGCGKTR